MEFETLERDVRLSQSLLWRLQKETYSQLGPQCWMQQEGVPFQITSNARIAKQYAALAALALKENPDLQFLELGGGSGKFAYLFLQELLPQVEVPVRYTLTDLAEKNVSYWKAHPLLMPYFERGILEASVYDPLNGPFEKLKDRPLFLIANYFFDSVEQDLFRVEKGQLFEGRISLQKSAQGLQEEYSYHPIEKVDDPEIGSLVERYRREFEQTSFLLPVGAFCAIKQFDSFVLLAGDKGFCTLKQIAECGEPCLNVRTAYSFPVNFHAIADVMQKRGGASLHPKNSDPLFSVHLFSSGVISEKLAAAYKEQFDCEKVSGKGFLPDLRAANWDASHFFSSLEKEELVEEREELLAHALQISRNFFPLCREEGLLLHNLETLLQKWGAPDLAKQVMEKASSFQLLPKRENMKTALFIDRAKPSGHVLLVGGGAEATQAIHKHHPKSVTVCSLSLEELAPLGIFDEIFFFPPAQEFAAREKKSSLLLVNEGKKQVQELEKRFSHLKKIVYSDADIDHFFSLLDRQVLSEPSHYLQFFSELRQNGSIDERQLELILKRLEREGLIAKEDLLQKRGPLRERHSFDEGAFFYQLIEQCVQSHTKPGSVIRGCLYDTTSKFEEQQMLENIISNPFLDYKEEVHQKTLWVTITCF